MKNTLLLILVLLSRIGISQDTTWMTYCEKSGFTKTPRYKETMAYLKKVSDGSPMVQLRSFGESSQGKPLPLVIVDKQGLTEPDKIRGAGRILLMIQACIHPGECEGKDAGMMLLRDLTLFSKYPGLLDHVSILFIPIFNVDGHERFGPYNRINQNGPEEMGWRVTATNLNLNRDYIKADAPEMQSWLRLFSKWVPEFFIDIHTTDGADYQYPLTYYMNVNGGMDDSLSVWSKDIFLKSWTSALEKEGYPAFHYVEFRSWHNPKSGIDSRVSPPMLSQGYTALRNKPGLLIETHMLKPYKVRVNATYQSLVQALTILNKEYSVLRNLEVRADQAASSPEFRRRPFPLTYAVDHKDSTLLDFLGIHYTQVKSEITGEEYFKYGKDKETMKIPYFEKNEPLVSVNLPEAYIIPTEWRIVIERMKLHGVQYHKLTKDTPVKVKGYRVTNPKWQATPYEGKFPLISFDIEEITFERVYPIGSMVLDMNQPYARLIAEALEPKGNGSFFFWGYFSSIFEQKEYAEHYVMEEMAKKMLEEDPALKKEFEQKKQQDAAFASNPDAILNWFYSRTPYWDQRKDIYPVGKIYDRKVLDALISK